MQRTTLFAGTLPIAYMDSGSGSRTFLLLHGGAGPRTMLGLANLLTASNHRAITPVHPGFDGEPRPAHCTSVGDLATAYLALLERLQLTDVLVAGNSLGGWIAVEMAARSPARISGVVNINGVGLDTVGTGLAITDLFSVPPPQRMQLAWHDVSKAPVPQGEAALAALHGNLATMAVYSGGAHYAYDPTLRGRLEAAGGVALPVLVLWGESDGVVTVEHIEQSLAGSRASVDEADLARYDYFQRVMSKTGEHRRGQSDSDDEDEDQWMDDEQQGEKEEMGEEKEKDLEEKKGDDVDEKEEKKVEQGGGVKRRMGELERIRRRVRAAVAREMAAGSNAQQALNNVLQRFNTGKSKRREVERDESGGQDRKEEEDASSFQDRRPRRAVTSGLTAM